MTQRKIIWPGEAPSKSRKINFPNSEESSRGMKFLHKIGEALGGGAAGVAHGASDIGANIAQSPFDLYSWATGHPAFQVPRANFKQYAPQSQLGQTAESIGEFAAPFIGSPALAAEAGAGRALFGGKLLPRLGLDALLGSAESENRKLGAAFGAGAPAAGKAFKFLKETPLTQRGAAKNLEKAKALAGTEPMGIPMSIDFLRNMEYQMLSPHLKPSNLQINTLMGNAAKGDYPSYFALQSALGDISSELLHPAQQKSKGLLGLIGNYLSPPQTTAAERLTGQQLKQIKNQYVKEAMEHLTKSGKKKIAELETSGRERYRNYKNFLPIRNKIAFGALAGVPGIGYLKHLMDQG